MVFPMVIHGIVNGNCMVFEWYIIEFTIRVFVRVTCYINIKRAVNRIQRGIC